MKAAATLVSLAAMAGVALSQGVTSAIAPIASSPAGCSASYDGTFEITVAEVTIQKRSEPIAVSPYPLHETPNCLCPSPRVPHTFTGLNALKRSLRWTRFARDSARTTHENAAIFPQSRARF